MKYKLFFLFSDAESQVSEKTNNLLNFSHTLLSGEADIGRYNVRTINSAFFPLLHDRVVENMLRYSFYPVIMHFATLLKENSS